MISLFSKEDKEKMKSTSIGKSIDGYSGYFINEKGFVYTIVTKNSLRPVFGKKDNKVTYIFCHKGKTYREDLFALLNKYYPNITKEQFENEIILGLKEVFGDSIILHSNTLAKKSNNPNNSYEKRFYGERLKLLMVANGITEKDLSDEMLIPIEFVKSYLRSDKRPTDAVVSRLSIKFCVESAYFIDNEYSLNLTVKLNNDLLTTKQ